MMAGQMPRKRTTTSITLVGQLTVQAVLDVLTDLPPEGTVTISRTSPDRPGESTTTDITVVHP